MLAPAVIVFGLVLCPAGPTWGKKPVHGTANSSVFDRGLVSANPTAAEILSDQRHYREVAGRRFNGTTLGYVTPWNNHGYHVATVFGQKFTHISPVWLQVRCEGPLAYQVAGTHDVDQDWMGKIMQTSKVIPRILFDDWTGKDYSRLFTSPAEMAALAKVLLAVCKKYDFDGLVLEVWSQLGPTASKPLIELIKTISKKFRDNYELVLVIPPMRGLKTEFFSKKHFDALYNHVSAFSLMTYDYSNPGKPGPNSPIDWVRQCVEGLTDDTAKRAKILLGLNFYGNRYTVNGGGPIINHEYLSMLKDYDGTLEWDENAKEHFFEFKKDNDRNTVFYPTLYSIEKRIQLASDLSTGLSIWEIGQGLDYFYDLL